MKIITLKNVIFSSPKKSPVDKLSFRALERMDNPEEGLKKVIVQYYPENSELGKHAETDFEIVIENEQFFCAGLAFPKTGRTHQIRVHATAHKIPLVGDKLYLGGYPMFQRFKDGIATEDDHKQMIISRHALHAMALSITYNQKRNYLFPGFQKIRRFY